MSDVSFTYDRYRTYLEELQSHGFGFRQFGTDPGEGNVILRHDVDLSPERAVEIARIEAELGIGSTYFFLMGAPFYNPFDRVIRDRIAEIVDLGHDVGLHFSTHQYWNQARPPDSQPLVRTIRREQVTFSLIAPSVAPFVSFHIPPDWVLGRRFDDIESTYEPRFFDRIEYRSDSGQRWRDEGLPDLHPPATVQLLTHPGLWGRRDRSFDERVEAAITEAGERTREYARSRYLEAGSDGLGPSTPEAPEV